MGGQFAGQKLRIRTGDKNADVMCGPKGVDNQFKLRYILYFVNEQIVFFSVFNSIFNVFIKGIRIAYFSEFIVFKIDINDMVIGLKKIDKTDSRQYTEIFVKSKESAKARIREYLKGTIVEEYENGDALIKATIVENEQLWIGTLLSLGNLAEVLAPEKIRKRLLDAAKNIVFLYEKL